MENVYDLIIIGLGPASMSAQLYAIRYNMKVMSIGAIPGGLMMESHKICNWPGETEIAGATLTQKMFGQLQANKAEMTMDLVDSISREDGSFKLLTKGAKEFWAKNILIATGTKHRHLGVDGEERLTGKGVAFCATCDAMFYKGKTTMVVGGGNSAMTASLYLADICPKVYLVYRDGSLNGEVAWMKEIDSKDNIIKIANNSVASIQGEDKVTGIELVSDYEGSRHLVVDGVFIEIGLLPTNELFKALGGELDDWGYIKVKADMSTNIPGVYSAGDVTNGSNNFRQIATAVAEGAIAADSVFKALKS